MAHHSHRGPYCLEVVLFNLKIMLYLDCLHGNVPHLDIFNMVSFQKRCSLFAIFREDLKHKGIVTVEDGSVFIEQLMTDAECGRLESKRV